MSKTLCLLVGALLSVPVLPTPFSALSQHQQERGDSFLGRFSPQQQHLILRRGKLIRRQRKQMDFEFWKFVKQGSQFGSRKTTERNSGHRFGVAHIRIVEIIAEKIVGIEEACDLAPPIGQSLGRLNHPSHNLEHEAGWIALEEEILARLEVNFFGYRV